MRVFPAEAFSVRNEVEFPEFLRINAFAQNPRHAIALEGFLNQHPIFQTEGPMMPPHSLELIKDNLHFSIGQIDQEIRGIIQQGGLKPQNYDSMN